MTLNFNYKLLDTLVNLKKIFFAIVILNYRNS